MNSRKIKTQGINPSSFLIHPATLRFIKKNQNINKITLETKSHQNVMLIPEISFSAETILDYYEIKYLKDLEDKLFDYPDLTRIRLLKIFFTNNKTIKNYQENNIPNIYNFLKEKFNFKTNTINNELTNLINNVSSKF